jgi:hypothetical protein
MCYITLFQRNFNGLDGWNDPWRDYDTKHAQFAP